MPSIKPSTLAEAQINSYKLRKPSTLKEAQFNGYKIGVQRMALEKSIKEEMFKQKAVIIASIALEIFLAAGIAVGIAMICTGSILAGCIITPLFLAVDSLYLIYLSSISHRNGHVYRDLFPYAESIQNKINTLNEEILPKCDAIIRQYELEQKKEQSKKEQSLYPSYSSEIPSAPPQPLTDGPDGPGYGETL